MKSLSILHGVVQFVVFLWFIAPLLPIYVVAAPITLTLPETFSEVNSTSSSNSMDSAKAKANLFLYKFDRDCLLYTSPSPRDS